MTPQRPRFARLRWPVLGGAWGAWIGCEGVYQQIVPQLNTDTSAPIFVWGFLIFFAGVGLVIGAVSATAVGGSLEGVLRRMGLRPGAALTVALLGSGLALWQLSDLIQARYPGLGAAPAAPTVRTTVGAAMDLSLTVVSQTPCSATPPEDPRSRELWDAECR